MGVSNDDGAASFILACPLVKLSRTACCSDRIEVEIAREREREENLVEVCAAPGRTLIHVIHNCRWIFIVEQRLFVVSRARARAYVRQSLLDVDD